MTNLNSRICKVFRTDNNELLAFDHNGNKILHLCKREYSAEAHLEILERSDYNTEFHGLLGVYHIDTLRRIVKKYSKSPLLKPIKKSKMNSTINAFTGSSGVGKTTLLNELKEKDFKVIELSGRPYLPNTGDYVANSSDLIQTRINYGSLITFTKEIIEAQSQGYDIFYSRCAIDKLAYARTLGVGMDYEDLLIKEIQEIVIPYIHVYYIPVEFPLPQTVDIQRGNNEEMRIAVDKEIKNILIKMDIDYTTVSGSIRQRLKQLGF